MIRLVRREQLNIMENGERGMGNGKYCEFSVPHSLFPILRGRRREDSSRLSARAWISLERH